MNETTHFTGTKIKAILTAQGRRQDWLASQVGVATSTVSRWMSGELPIRKEHAEKVASALGVPFFLVVESRKSDNSSRYEEAA